MVARIFAGVLGLCVLVGCSHDAVVSSALDTEASGSTTLDLLSKRNGPKAKPIWGDFTTDLVTDPFAAPDRCGPFDPPNGEFNLLNVQAGSGLLKGVGPVEVAFEFCVDVSNPAAGIPYFNGFGVYTTRSGDQLFTTAEGIVMLSDTPPYEFEFNDPFTVTGGTGRFEGATGTGSLDSIVDNDLVLDDGTVVSRTFHSFEATLAYDE